VSADGVDIDALNDLCLEFIEARGRSHANSMARSKLGEMIYWLRADEARRVREDEANSGSSPPLHEPERSAGDGALLAGSP